MGAIESSVSSNQLEVQVRFKLINLLSGSDIGWRNPWGGWPFFSGGKDKGAVEGRLLWCDTAVDLFVNRQSSLVNLGWADGWGSWILVEEWNGDGNSHLTLVEGQFPHVLGTSTRTTGAHPAPRTVSSTILFSGLLRSITITTLRYIMIDHDG